MRSGAGEHTLTVRMITLGRVRLYYHQPPFASYLGLPTYLPTHLPTYSPTPLEANVLRCVMVRDVTPTNIVFSEMTPQDPFISRQSSMLSSLPSWAGVAVRRFCLILFGRSPRSVGTFVATPRFFRLNPLRLSRCPNPVERSLACSPHRPSY